MEYRTLENIDSICIYEAFTQAFSDYQVSVDMSFKSFETMLKSKIRLHPKKNGCSLLRAQ